DTLTVRELSRCRFDGLEHVTLSACWSAHNFVLPGRWVISLQETLCRAGARSVLGSLWPVDDKISVCFMRRFYEHLLRAPRDEALRRTQLECLAGALRGAGDAARDPLYWAGYNLYGDA